MNVSIDARIGQYGSSGIGYYVRALTRALQELDGDDHYTLVLARSLPREGFTLGPRVSVVETDVTHQSYVLRDLYEQLWLPLQLRRRRIDVHHDPEYIAPFGPFRLPTVVTVYDMSLFLYPHLYRAATYQRVKRLMWLSVRRASAIIAGSEHTRQDIIRLLRVREGRVATVYIACADHFRPIEDEKRIAEVRARHGIRGRYVLHVGSLNPRKNLVRLIEAFGRVRERVKDCQLVLAGPPGWLFDPIKAAAEASPAARDIVFTGPVPDEDMPPLYSGAAVLAYPSLYEGFGLPVLEAMRCRTPVIASNVSSIPEVAGDAAWMVDPEDVGALADALSTVLTEPGVARDLRERGQKRAALFSWERAARETRAVYQMAAGGGR